MKSDKAPPAFPHEEGYDFKGERVVSSCPGMTLRDYFAGQAIMGAFLSSSDPGHIAIWAYEIADAMIEKRGEDL